MAACFSHIDRPQEIEETEIMKFLRDVCNNNPGIIDDMCHYWEKNLFVDDPKRRTYKKIDELRPEDFTSVLKQYPKIYKHKPESTKPRMHDKAESTKPHMHGVATPNYIRQSPSPAPPSYIDVFAHVTDFRRFLDDREKRDEAWFMICDACNTHPHHEIATPNFASGFSSILEKFLDTYINPNNYRRRPISSREIMSICARRGLARYIRADIEKKNFQKVFWPDFSKIIVLIFLIRRQYFMTNPLQVLGFVTKESVSGILSNVKHRAQMNDNNPSGCFQLRFSTNYPGSLNLVYLDSKWQQKTILIGVSASRNCFKINVGGSEKDVKDLPALFSWLKLKHLMVIKRESSQQVDSRPVDGSEMLRIPTEQIFGLAKHRSNHGYPNGGYG